jgi:hypothetical protein
MYPVRTSPGCPVRTPSVQRLRHAWTMLLEQQTMSDRRVELAELLSRPGQIELVLPV